MRFFT